MKISVSYRGSSDKLSGFVFDTEKKTYATFVINGKDWTRSEMKKTDRGVYMYSYPKKGFDTPGDIHFDERTLADVEGYLYQVEKIGFKETDDAIDFGIEGLPYKKMKH